MWQVRVVVRGGRVGDGEQGTDPPRRAGLLMLDQRTANEKETEQEVWQGNEDRGGQRRRAWREYVNRKEKLGTTRTTHWAPYSAPEDLPSECSYCRPVSPTQSVAGARTKWRGTR